MKTEIPCPHCQKTITSLSIARLKVESERHHALLFCCPECDAVISAQIDPIAVMGEGRDSIQRDIADLKKSLVIP